MKILQRRVKGSALTASVLSKRIKHYQDILWSRWQMLSARDQAALGVLTVFLLLFIGGYGGYSVHLAAKNSKERYQAQVTDYFWLRSQAGNIDSSLSSKNTEDGAAVSPANRVNAALNESGINDAQVVAMGESVQFSFIHPSQAAVSAALAKLEQQGWQFTKLSMQQDSITKHIQVQSIVTS